MSAFVITIIALTLLALAFVVPVLLSRKPLEAETFDEYNIQIARETLADLKQELAAGRVTQADYDQAKDELEASLAQDLAVSKAALDSQQAEQPSKKTALVMLLLIPLASVIIYAELGSFSSIGQPAKQIAANAHQQQQQQQQAPQISIEEAVVSLKKRLAEEPDNPEGWFMLGRTYMALNRFPEAADAYEKTIKLVGEEPDLLFRYADALAMTEGGRMTGKARQVIDKILQANPNHPQGLWMGGMAADQAGDHKRALTLWYRLEPMLNNNIESQAELRNMMARAESKLSAAELKSIKSTQAKPTQAKPVVATGAAEINVTVKLDAALTQKVSPTDTLFIFARALQGPPMPLAAVKQPASALPITINLNDAMAMMPTMKLSNFKQVTVAAVISKSGQPGTQPGDLYGEVSPVEVNSKQQVAVTINKIK